MQGLLYSSLSYWDRDSDSEETVNHICVDKKVHVIQSFRDGYFILNWVPCDGSCEKKFVDVDADVETAVAECLATGTHGYKLVHLEPEDPMVEPEPELGSDASPEDIAQAQADAALGKTATIGEIISSKIRAR